MTRVCDSVLELIGGTPMVRLNHVVGEGAGEVWAKLEYFNPGGSIKDRACLGMIRAAQADGTLQPGATIIEPTAGNTGVGAAIMGLLEGYRVICVMPEKFRGNKSTLVEAMGGEVVFTPTEEGFGFAFETVERLLGEIEGAVTLSQFTNPANPDAHQQTTAPELFEQLEGRVDAVCIGGGTGGTFTGVARYFREELPGCRMVLVEPEGSIFGGGEYAGYRVEGIGSAFVPETLDMELVDAVATIPEDEIFAMVRELARREGLLVGGSAGAAACAAVAEARRLGPGSRVACIFPDAAERYMGKEYLGPGT